MVKLEISDLSFSYGERTVFQGISFVAEEAGVLGIVGPNGSGKTTLIKCIDQILRPAGSIRIDGADLRTMNRREVARRISYVPQTLPQSSSSTVFETILMGRRPHLSWRVRPEDEEAVVGAMNLLGIGEFAFRRVNELSGGERQRVMIARALVQDTGILLLDEPTSSLDLLHQMEVMELVHRLAEERGITVIIAIHDLNLAARYCHRLLMLRQGAIRGDGTPAALLTREMIRDVYGIEAAVKHDLGIPYVVPLRPLGRGTAGVQQGPPDR